MVSFLHVFSLKCYHTYSLPAYGVSHEISVKLGVGIHWNILGEKYYFSIGQNLNLYVVMVIEKEKALTCTLDGFNLTEEMNNLHRKGTVLVFNYIVT